MNTLTTKQKIFNSPITKIILSLLVCIIFVNIGQEITKKLLGFTSLDKNYRNLIKGVIVSILAITSYRLFFKYYEKRKIIELSFNKLARNLILGTLIGIILQSLTIFVMYVNGNFSVISVNPVSFIIIPITIAFTVAIFEEILIRGIVFRIIEEKLGSYYALFISAALFGALHLPNEGSTLFSAVSVAIEAGLLLGMAFIYSRNLWFPIALHFAWNFMQSGIFGAVTSGNQKTDSLLVTKIQGPEILTGGEFGPEGSIQAIVFCIIATGILLFLCHKENKIILPYWKNK
jgi:membrane protease YdiL (CAAX protease family)